MNVLICSHRGEVQVDEIMKIAKNVGLNCVLFERFRKDQFISYQYSKSTTSAILTVDEQHYTLDSKTFPIVWYRPKPILLSELPGENGSIEEKFCVQEWRAILLSLDIFLGESKWINPIWHNQRASCKAYQLKLAQELGLNIPETSITNDASQTATLFKNNRVIYKTLSSFLTAKDAIYTNEINLEDVLRRRAEIAMAPGIFQKYIEKKYELRVTVIGDKIFVVRINSQLCEDTAIDWRRNPNPSLYELSELTPQTKEKLLLFHRILGLVYAAYDFIVDKEDREIFLECNPSGQWLWLENALGIEISKIMVDELTRVDVRGYHA